MKEDRPPLSGPAVDTGTETRRPQRPELVLGDLHSLFMGRDGLRAGWGLLLFFVIFSSLKATAFIGIQAVRYRPASSAPRSQAAEHPTEQTIETAEELLPYEGAAFVMVALTTWIMGRIERRSTAEYGFAGPKRAARFFAGFAWGIAFLSLLVGALGRFGLLVFDGRLVFDTGILKQGAIWLVGFLFVALLEEFHLRAYLQFTLARGAASLYSMFLVEDGRAKTLGFWTAAAILSFVFGIGHAGNPGESPIGLASAALIGFVLCLTLWRTGSLWWAIGFHAAWDWAQSFLFGVADSGFLVHGRLFATHPAGRILLSGGTTGPEGSALILPLLLVLTGVVMLIPKERNLEPASQIGQQKGSA